MVSLLLLSPMIILVVFMLKCVSTNWLRQIAAYYRRLLSEMSSARCHKTQFMCLAPPQASGYKEGSESEMLPGS